MRVVVAIDSFKGCVTSKDANQAAAEGAKKAWPEAEIVQVPVSDGGEGFLEAFHAAIGGEIIELTVRDPLMRPVTAKYNASELMHLCPSYHRWTMYVYVPLMGGLLLLYNHRRYRFYV